MVNRLKLSLSLCPLWQLLSRPLISSETLRTQRPQQRQLDSQQKTQRSLLCKQSNQKPCSSYLQMATSPSLPGNSGTTRDRHPSTPSSRSRLMKASREWVPSPNLTSEEQALAGPQLSLSHSETSSNPLAPCLLWSTFSTSMCT